MIALTASVTVPNITRIKLARSPSFAEGATILEFEVLSSAANNRSKRYTVVVRNGGGDGVELSDTLMVNPAPRGFGDGLMVSSASLDLSGGSDQVEAAYRTGASRGAAVRAVEQKCLDLGILHSSLAGTVS